jgi:predicted MarR family transcription regulator
VGAVSDIELNAIQKAILVSLCTKTKGSKGAHLPKPYFMNKPQIQGHKADRALRELVALGYIRKHPTGGETTYELDDRGFEACQKIRDQRKAI